MTGAPAQGRTEGANRNLALESRDAGEGQSQARSVSRDPAEINRQPALLAALTDFYFHFDENQT